MSALEPTKKRRERRGLDGGLSIIAGLVIACAEGGGSRYARIGVALEALAEPIRKGSFIGAHVALVGRWARG